MRTISKILVLGGAAAVAGTLGMAALADMPMRGGAHGTGMGHGMMGQMGGGTDHGMGGGTQHGGPGHAMADPARMEALKIELGITPAQEAAWDKYASTLQAAAATMKTAHEGVDHEAVGRMSPPDRFAFMTRMREQGQNQFGTVQNAANELLAALDDTQKTKAEGILPGLVKRGKGMTHGAAMSGQHHGHTNR